MATISITGRRYDTAEPVSVEITDGAVTSVAAAAVSAGEAAALPWIAPGFVDLQVNGYGGQEFSSPTLAIEHVAAVTRQMSAFGVTRYCPTVTTNGFDVLAHAMRTIAASCEADAAVARSVLGIHLEGPYISPVDGPRRAHPLVHCRPPDWEFSRLQEAAQGRIRLVTLSPEYDAAPPFIKRAVASGVTVALAHLAANSEQIRAAVDAGAQMSTHLGNGSHRQLPRHPNYLWDQLAEDRLMASLIVDGHHLPPEVVKSFVRAKTPERCILVSDLSGLAGLPPDRYTSELCDLEILADGKLVLAGQTQLLAGASRPIGDGIANVMRFAGVDLKTAVDMATVHPLRVMGQANSPGFHAGETHDWVLFDLPAETHGGASSHERVTIRRTIES